MAGLREVMKDLKPSTSLGSSVRDPRRGRSSELGWLGQFCFAFLVGLIAWCSHKKKRKQMKRKKNKKVFQGFPWIF